MKIRLTPLRAAYLRGQFLEAAKTDLRHLSEAAHESRREFLPECKEYPHALASQAAHLIESRVSAFYGPETELDDRIAYGASPAFKAAKAISERSARWRVRGDFYEALAKKRSLSGILPAEYAHDGEIRSQLADILKARRDGWAAAGHPLGSEEWRTVDLSKPVVVLDTPNGCYKIHRSVVVTDEERGAFTGKVILDERLATFGGCFRTQAEDRKVRRLFYMRGMIGHFVVARAVIRSSGRWYAKEVIRRLRAGCKPNFTAIPGRYGQPGNTRIILSPGKVPRELTAKWQARAARIRDLVGKRDAAILNLQGSAQMAARKFADEPAISALETQARLIAAERRWSNASERFNSIAAHFGLKKTLGSLPVTAPLPPQSMPQARAGLCDRDARNWSRAEHEFHECFTEVLAARLAMSALSPMPEAAPAAATPDPIAFTAEPQVVALGQGVFGF